MFVALAGMGLGLLGAQQDAEAVKDSARYNAEQAEEDIKLLEINENMALADARYQGASDLAAIEGVTSASGVKVGEGSALSAIRFQAEQNAQEEFNIKLQTKVAAQNRRAGAALETQRASNQARSIKMGAAGNALSQGANLYMAGQ